VESPRAPTRFPTESKKLEFARIVLIVVMGISTMPHIFDDFNFGCTYDMFWFYYSFIPKILPLGVGILLTNHNESHGNWKKFSIPVFLLLIIICTVSGIDNFLWLANVLTSGGSLNSLAMKNFNWFIFNMLFVFFVASVYMRKKLFVKCSSSLVIAISIWCLINNFRYLIENGSSLWKWDVLLMPVAYIILACVFYKLQTIEKRTCQSNHVSSESGHNGVETKSTTMSGKFRINPSVITAIIVSVILVFLICIQFASPMKELTVVADNETGIFSFVDIRKNQIISYDTLFINNLRLVEKSNLERDLPVTIIHNSDGEIYVKFITQKASSALKKNELGYVYFGHPALFKANMGNKWKYKLSDGNLYVETND